MILKNISEIIFFEQWISERKRKPLKDSTIGVYTGVIKLFLDSNPDVNDLDSYNQFIIAHSIKKRSFHVYTALKLYIEYKVTDTATRNRILEGMIYQPPDNNVKHNRRYLDEDQLFKMLTYLKEPKHQIVAIIQILTGTRASDVLLVKRGDINLETSNDNIIMRIVFRGKRDKRQVCYIHDQTFINMIYSYINENMNDDKYYFLQHRQSNLKNKDIDSKVYYRINQNNYHCYWEDLKQATNSMGYNSEDFSTHDFKRCFARRAWEKFGKDISILQDLLNHEDPKTTIRYLKQSGLKNMDYYKVLQTE